jgi:N-acetylmuramoyl-L-alanine amidase
MRKATVKRRRKRRYRYNIKAFAALFFILILLITILVVTCRFFWTSSRYPDHAICLDAGHGGSYTGAVYNGRMEKDDTLKIALEVQRVLEQQGQKVLMTRSGDDDVGLEERTDLANDHDALVFVSLHRNSGDGNGTEIWVEHTAPEPDTTLANNILNRLEQAGIQSNRGVKFGYRDNNSNEDYSVNRESNMPSCLVELGFMENETDNELFDSHLKAYGKAIAIGIMETFGFEFDESLYTES